MIKKLFLSIAILLVAGNMTTATAQVKLGVVAGANMSKLSFEKGMHFDSDKRTGWYVGPKMWVSLPLVGLGLNVSAQYCWRRLNSQVDNNGIEESKSKSLNTIEIPINVRYTIGPGSVFSVFGETGPQFGYNVGNKHISDILEYKSANFTWNVGLGIRVFKRIEASVGYNIAVSNFGKYRIERDNASTLYNSFKTNTWQFQAALLF